MIPVVINKLNTRFCGDYFTASLISDTPQVMMVLRSETSGASKKLKIKASTLTRKLILK